jgi:anti-anti-sigma regulatory factor
LRSLLLELLRERNAIDLDLAAIEACDTVALQLLCSAHKTASTSGKHFRVSAISASVTTYCETIGLKPLTAWMS